MPKGKTGGDEGERELSETSAIIGVFVRKEQGTTRFVAPVACVPQT